MRQLPSIRISDYLFGLLGEWRSKKRPIPGKAEAMRVLLRKALEKDLQENV